jgi:glycosyltransferase involved in cell wall biosynthesis
MKISIITINYNNKDGLKKTIESVIHQSYDDIEYIIIDGGSTDGSTAYIREKQKHFSYWVSEPDKGIYNAMNKGIDQANGDYLLFLNSGDWLYNTDVISFVSERLERGFDIYYGNIAYLNNENELKIEYFPQALSFGFFYKGYLPHPSSFIKRTLFDRVFYYNETFTIISDWEFFICAICKYNATYQYLDKLITIFEGGGISQEEKNLKTIELEKEKSLFTHFPLFLEDYSLMNEYRRITRSYNIKVLLNIENSFIIKWLTKLWLKLLSKLFK